MVFGVLEEWMQTELKGQVSACKQAGDEEEAMTWTLTLAYVLSDQGRHDEALEMGEQALEVWRRMFADDDPRIGKCDLVCIVAC